MLHHATQSIRPYVQCRSQECQKYESNKLKGAKLQFFYYCNEIVHSLRMPVYLDMGTSLLLYLQSRKIFSIGRYATIYIYCETIFEATDLNKQVAS